MYTTVILATVFGFLAMEDNKNPIDKHNTLM